MTVYGCTRYRPPVQGSRPRDQRNQHVTTASLFIEAAVTAVWQGQWRLPLWQEARHKSGIPDFRTWVRTPIHASDPENPRVVTYPDL